MLTISLHKIKLIAPHGLYPQEHMLNNTFEIDVDVYVPVSKPWPYVDYTEIHAAVLSIFNGQGLYLETFVEKIHEALQARFPYAVKIRVAIRKLNPPMPGEVAWAQVCYEA
jgi:7,8-dihydroneopterin aldolase/epimerase/oxygenase